MSLLVDPDGSLKNYVVVNTREETVLAAYNWVGEAGKGMKELAKGGVSDLALYNITHSCPDWLKEWVRSDSEYCSRKADGIEKRAAALRRQAANLLDQAEEMERRAAKWRELSRPDEAPIGPVPGM